MDSSISGRRANAPAATQAPAPTRLHVHADDPPSVAASVFRPFFLGGIAVVLTAGAAWGVLLLWKIGLSQSFTGVTVHEVNAHGHAQIMGWVGLFIMGVSYQMLPRLWATPLPAPGLARVVLLLMLPGIAMRSTAMMFGQADWAPGLHAVGMALEVTAVSVFVAQLFLVFARSHQPCRPAAAFAIAALGFLLLQTLYGGWHAHQLMVAPDRDTLLHQIATYQASLRDMQIHGLAVMMIFAVALRLFPVFFGLPDIPVRRAWIAWALMLGAVLMEVGFFLTYQWTGYHAVAGLLLLPWLMLPAAAWMLAGPWRLWRPLPTVNRTGKFIRVAFAWLFVSYAMLLMLPVYQAVSGITFSHAYYGAIRHAITVGFVSMMIVGMSAEMVPRLRGIDAARLTALWPTFVLLNLGCLLRVVLQVGTDWHPLCFKLVGISGALEWTALALWGGHLAGLMLRGHRPSLNPLGPGVDG